MKLDSRRVDAFLRDPGAARAVLLYGEDDGLVRERGALLARSVVGSLSDPFRLAELDRESHSRMVQEMTALCLTGGRRVIRVREVSDALSPTLQVALSGPGDALLILEAGALTPKSRLRLLADQREDVVGIACYHDEAGGLERMIRSILEEWHISIDREALHWLMGHLGLDRGATRQEMEKLALYAGRDGRVDLAAAMTAVGDIAGLQLDDALFAATEGDIAGADRALELALSEGVLPVSVLRAALMHLHRLQRARATMDQGVSAEAATSGVRPPVFSRRQPHFIRALRLWSETSLEAACAFVSAAEHECKKTGSPGEVLCQNAISFLVRRSRSRRA